jgi:hypothetical protein
LHFKSCPFVFGINFSISQGEAGRCRFNFFLIRQAMSKKKRSTAKRGNKQSVNSSNRSNQTTKLSRSSRILRFLINQLISIVLKVIFEKRIKDLLSWAWTLIIG